MSKHVTIHLADFPQEAANHILEIGRKALAECGLFRLSLAGGNTPRVVYEAMAKLGADFDWRKTQITFGDERCVPPDHADSNYRMANEAMISKVPVPAENVHRMKAEESDIDAAAADYEALLRRHFNLKEGQWPRFDLLLLGMVDDGHTASLFPGTKALGEKQRIVVSNWVEKFNTNRMTLSAPAINNSRTILFMAAGDSKRGPLKEVLSGERNPNLYPSQLIEATDGKVIWMVDEAAVGGESYS